MKKNTQHYDKKVEAVKKLLLLDTKKIESKNIKAVSEESGISSPVLVRAFKMLTEEGIISKHKYENVYSNEEKNYYRQYNYEYFNNYKKNKNITRKEAGDILRDYIFTSISMKDLMKKYKINHNQFYSWCNELHNHGTLLGEVVLDPEKYAKNTFKDALRLEKRNRFTGDDDKKLQIIRVIQVLKYYL